MSTARAGAAAWFHDRWPGPGHRHAFDAEVLAREEGAGGAIEVLRHASFGRLLAVGGRVRLVESDPAYVELAVHVPLCGRERPARRALVLGGDDGALVRELLRDVGVDEVTVVPADPAVVALARAHLDASAVLDDPRVAIGAKGDVAARGPYDLVIADLFADAVVARLDPLALLADDGVYATAAACVHAADRRGVLPHAGWCPPSAAAWPAPEEYVSATPLSPGGFVAFRLYGRAGEHRAPRRAWSGRHYHADVHRAVFALPTWWRAGFPVLDLTDDESDVGTWWHEDTEGSGVSQALALAPVSAEQSRFQTIEAFDHAVYGRVLALDHTIQGSIADEAIYHELVAHVPLLGRARAARQVLIAGGGDWGVAREVLRHPEVERVVMVEIDQRVIDVSEERYLPAPRDPRLELHVDDAAAYVAAAARRGERFDCILADTADSTEASMTLWTDRFFEDLRACLADDGVCVDSDILIGGLDRARLSRDRRGEGLTWIRRARACFGAVESYLSRVPLYPGGHFAYFLYTRDGRSHARPRAPFTGRFYNAELHRAVFALPTWWRETLAAL